MLNPAKDRQILDWENCKSEVIGDLANDLGEAIKAAWDGVHTINFPEKSQVTDLWSGRNFGAISQLKIQMKTGDNLLLWLH